MVETIPATMATKIYAEGNPFAPYSAKNNALTAGLMMSKTEMIKIYNALKDAVKIVTDININTTGTSG